MITANKLLEPYHKIAQEEAKKSPCARRQYGAVVTHTREFYYSVGNNARVSECCKGICARTRYGLQNGERVEVGAEVHAETAALIAYNPPNPGKAVVILAGYAGERELLGVDVYPCHTCAVNLKYANINYVYLKNKDGYLGPVSMSEIIEYREAEWAPDV